MRHFSATAFVTKTLLSWFWPFLAGLPSFLEILRQMWVVDIPNVFPKVVLWHVNAIFSLSPDVGSVINHEHHRLSIWKQVA